MEKITDGQPLDMEELLSGCGRMWDDLVGRTMIVEVAKQKSCIFCSYASDGEE